jgi:poly(A) polymerase
MVEITTHRSEKYQADSRKPQVEFSSTIHDDLARRDFTINAMAIELPNWQLVDPFNGRTDLAKRVLQTPLTPEIAFSDDPLRMLRAARFLSGYQLMPPKELENAMISCGCRNISQINSDLLLDAPSAAERD